MPLSVLSFIYTLNVLIRINDCFSFIDSPLVAGDNCIFAESVKGTCKKFSDCSNFNSNEEKIQYCDTFGKLRLICCPQYNNLSTSTSLSTFACGKTKTKQINSNPPFRNDLSERTAYRSTEKNQSIREKEFDFVVAIHGGHDADKGKWPWIIAIRHSDASRYFCGGVLIDNRHVLTAAHCIPHQSSGKQLICRVGDVNQKEYFVEKIVVHPGYINGAYHDDLAVLKFAKTVDDPMPICLPQTSNINYNGQNVHVAGWGHTQFRGDPSEELQEIILPIFDLNECERRYEQTRIYNRYFPGGFGNTKICAAENDGSKDACQGDSGGPMMRYIDSKQIFELVGVTSSGIGCGNKDYPGVYTRIDAYLDFISRSIANH